MNTMFSILIPFALALVSFGCAGPSRKQYAHLLHECREHLREYQRVVKSFEDHCQLGPEQASGVIGFGEAGH